MKERTVFVRGYMQAQWERKVIWAQKKEILGKMNKKTATFKQTSPRFLPFEYYHWKKQTN
jgi:hypothetical protein